MAHDTPGSTCHSRTGGGPRQQFLRRWFAANDVVVVKTNDQWSARGGTNTDLLRGLIRAILSHPDGFTGEIVIGENTQFASEDDFDRSGNNSQDRTQSPRDVVSNFRVYLDNSMQ